MTTTNIKWITGLFLWFSQLSLDWSHLSGLFKGTRTHLTCLKRQGTHTHTHTLRLTHDQRWLMTDIHSVLHHITGRVEMCIRVKLQTGNCRRISFHLHDIHSSYLTEQSNCSNTLYVLDALIQVPMDLWLQINIFHVPSEVVRANKAERLFQFYSLWWSNQIKSNHGLWVLNHLLLKKKYKISWIFCIIV